MNRELNLRKARKKQRIAEQIAKAYRAFIANADASQTDIGDASGLGRAEISRLKKGTYEPKISTLAKVMQAAGPARLIVEAGKNGVSVSIEKM
jgi:predicted transcriptional regulator